MPATSNAPRTAFSIGLPEERVVRSLGRYFYAAVPQFVRRSYSDGSTTFVRQAVRRLREAGYVEWLLSDAPRQGGRSLPVYRLTRKGMRYLSSQGFDVELRYRPSEGVHSYAKLRHLLAITDFLIAADLFVESIGGVRIADVLHERHLSRDPFVARIDDHKFTLVPDAWVDIRCPFNGGMRVPIHLELDRATEGQHKWRKKVRAIVAWVNGPYQGRFGTGYLTVAVVCPGNWERSDQLIEWTLRELKQTQAMKEADTFLFTGLDPATADPVELFAGNAWRRLEQPDTVPLIPLRREEALQA